MYSLTEYFLNKLKQSVFNLKNRKKEAVPINCLRLLEALSC